MYLIRFFFLHFFWLVPSTPLIFLVNMQVLGKVRKAKTLHQHHPDVLGMFGILRAGQVWRVWQVPEQVQGQERGAG